MHLTPFSFKMHSSSHYNNNKIFTVNKKVQVNSRSFWQWPIALRICLFWILFTVIIFERIHISETGPLPVLMLKGEKEPTQLFDRKSYSLSMNNKQLPTSTHIPRFNICHSEKNKIIQITINSCSFRHSWEMPQFLTIFIFSFRQMTVPDSKRKYRGN